MTTLSREIAVAEEALGRVLARAQYRSRRPDKIIEIVLNSIGARGIRQFSTCRRRLRLAKRRLRQHAGVRVRTDVERRAEERRRLRDKRRDRLRGRSAG